MEMKLHLLENRAGRGIVSFGTCWPRGAVRSCLFAAENEAGERAVLQSVPVAKWPDGSLKWVRHTANAAHLGKQVCIRAGEAPVSPAKPISVQPENGGYRVRTSRMTFTVPAPGGGTLLQDVRVDGRPAAEKIVPVFLLSRVREEEDAAEEIIHPGRPCVEEVRIEEEGSASLALCFRGIYCADEKLMRFEIRLRVWDDLPELRITNTFFYQGEPDRDRMKGLGLRVWTALGGPGYSHHISFLADGVHFHEPAQLLESRIPRSGPAMKERQMAGQTVAYPPDTPEQRMLQAVCEAVPVWNQYRMDQQGAKCCEIRKRTRQGFCAIDAFHGERGDGVMALSGEERGLLVGLRDFWQRYPSALEARNLGGDKTEATIWFWSPEGKAMDFRHYDSRSYESNYEGFSYFGAEPNGIAATSEAVIRWTDGYADERELKDFSAQVQKPPVYAAAPADYLERGAFGVWSLPDREAPSCKRLEDDIDSAVAFYIGQQAQRGWYGFWDYGDFRHAYDAVRHTWKYDIGGFAWQQTELVPTYWLWLQFLRTGSETVFSLAEAMSRNTSEVDCYHFGPMQGVGSRHNVRHWGCPCKEPRVAMAGHHRPMYYLTGDLRMGACLAEMADAHLALPHIRWYTEQEGMVRCRTAPDWTSLLSDWMTAYERTGDARYRALAQKGIEGIRSAPMGFGSGPLFSFRPETGEMRYIGEDTGNIHLTQCFATLQILLEAADGMDLPELKEMCADYGRIYMMTPEEREKEYGSLVQGKGYAMRYTASGMGAWSGMKRNDAETKRRAWRELLLAAPERFGPMGFQGMVYAQTNAGKALEELPWISTNYISQWCLNAIMVPAFARDEMPSEAEMDRIAQEAYRLEL